MLAGSDSFRRFLRVVALAFVFAAISCQVTLAQKGRKKVVHVSGAPKHSSCVRTRWVAADALKTFSMLWVVRGVISMGGQAWEHGAILASSPVSTGHKTVPGYDPFQGW